MASSTYELSSEEIGLILIALRRLYSAIPDDYTEDDIADLEAKIEEGEAF